MKRVFVVISILLLSFMAKAQTEDMYVLLRNKGLVSAKERRWADALRQLKGAQGLNNTVEISNDIKVVTDSIYKVSERAFGLMNSEKYQEAIILFSSLEGTPKESFASVGKCYEGLGNYELAFDAYEKGKEKQEKMSFEYYNSLKRKLEPQKTLWEITWEDWRNEEPFLGFSYNYSRTFPLSMTSYFHSSYYYLGLELGINLDNKKYSFRTTTREKVGNTSSSSIVIVNGDTISSSSISTDEYNITTKDYDIDPIAYFGIVPGLNFNFWSVSCGIGLMCCKENLSVSSYAEGEGVEVSYNYLVVDYPLAFYLSPGIHCHIPIPGTEGAWRITPYANYRFMFAFRSNLSKAMSSYNSWAFGIGIEFNID